MFVQIYEYMWYIFRDILKQIPGLPFWDRDYIAVHKQQNFVLKKDMFKIIIAVVLNWKCVNLPALQLSVWMSRFRFKNVSVSGSSFCDARLEFFFIGCWTPWSVPYCHNIRETIYGLPEAQPLDRYCNGRATAVMVAVMVVRPL